MDGANLRRAEHGDLRVLVIEFQRSGPLTLPPASAGLWSIKVQGKEVTLSFREAGRGHGLEAEGQRGESTHTSVGSWQCGRQQPPAGSLRMQGPLSG